MRTLQEIVLEQPGTPEAREHAETAHALEAKVDSFLHRLDAELGSVASVTEIAPPPNCTRTTQQPRRNEHIDAILDLTKLI